MAFSHYSQWNWPAKPPNRKWPQFSAKFCIDLTLAVSAYGYLSGHKQFDTLIGHSPLINFTTPSCLALPTCQSWGCIRVCTFWPCVTDFSNSWCHWNPCLKPLAAIILLHDGWSEAVYCKEINAVCYFLADSYSFPQFPQLTSCEVKHQMRDKESRDNILTPVIIFSMGERS